MPNWTNRLIFVTALMVVTPLTARLAAPNTPVQTTSPTTAPVDKTTNETTAGKGAGKNKSQGGGAPAQQDKSKTELDKLNEIKNLSAEESGQELNEKLCDFLKLYSGNGEVSKTTDECSATEDGKVEAMIAILPDPVRTHLALRFDRGIDDLENTAGQLGWLFQQSWLPWPNELSPAASRYQDRYTDSQMENEKEKLPGVLLFREDGEKAKIPLVVFVVGDTPTGGVNVKQFDGAVAIWKRMKTRPCENIENCADGRRLMIMGPSFTGSGGSLRLLLQKNFPTKSVDGACADKTKLEIGIASGTMTSADKIEDLLEANGNCPSVAVVPATFAVDQMYARGLLLRFLDRRLKDPKSGIAELNEDESGFGAQTSTSTLIKVQREWNAKLGELSVITANIEAVTFFLNAVKEKAEKGGCEGPQKIACDTEKSKLQDALLELRPQKKELIKETSRQQELVNFLTALLKGPQPATLDAAQPAQLRTTTTKRPYLNLSFPREISVLRKAYEQNGIVGFGTSGGGGPKTELRLSLQEDSRDDDAVPSFSGSQGAISLESRMAQIAAMLENEKISVAVLSATDVLDEIFVARYLQTHAPSVTIVIQDADQLFLRGGTDGSLDGVYVVSPYPLIPKNGIWSTDQDSERLKEPFLAASQGDEGIAHALQYLLCGGGSDLYINFASSQGCTWRNRKGFNGKYLWMDEYEPPFPISPRSENDNKLQPPLWLSVIGHGGFQPVSLIDVDQQDANFPEASAYNLPRLGDVKQDANGEISVPETEPAGIQEEPLVPLKIVALLILTGIMMHGWACTKSRLNRAFAWSYAAADAGQWWIRLMVLVEMCLVGIYALSILFIHDAEGFHLESEPFKALLIVVQVALVAISGIAAWRMTESNVNRATRWWVTGAAFTVSGLFLIAADMWFWRLLGPSPGAAAERNFFYYRSAYLLNGASPALPMLLLLFALVLLLHGRMGKMVFHGGRIPRLPRNSEHTRCPSDRWMTRLNTLLSAPPVQRSNGEWRWNWVKIGGATIAALCVASVVTLSGQFGPHSLAYNWFDLVVDALAYSVAVATVHNLAVAWSAWQQLKGGCLLPLKQSPLRWGFNWVQGFSWKRLWTSPEGFSPNTQLEFVMRNVEAAGRTPVMQKVLDAYDHLLCMYVAEEGYTSIHRQGRWANHVVRLSARMYQELADASDEKISRLEKEWSSDHGALTGADRKRGFHEEQEPGGIATPAVRRQQLKRMADEEFVAMVYLSYIRSVLVQIRNRIGLSAGLYILLLWALTCYPWMNRHGILLEMCGLLALLAVVSITIYSQMQKDDILSRTTETQPGTLDREFFARILSVVGIPLLTLVATQFPEFNNVIFSWLEPSLTTFK